MRAALSILGLVVVLTIVLLMSKKQMQARQDLAPRPAASAASATADPNLPAAVGRQVQDSLDQARQRASGALP
ncbi:hypothetical protein G8A07_10275 [Roseateles sp. DAIF2]|uniref:hypothetical protein n=1 Tax=Roseateles sp. DAIF2 TaxID=2714952 RepID=UPI0018A322A6|nr:hypothetical protein [Roseateles sp. DAIF2]QPF73261.1 hypothetical protein G8A07_10275 [Roseateles sp. DAIF2]